MKTLIAITAAISMMLSYEKSQAQCTELVWAWNTCYNCQGSGIDQCMHCKGTGTEFGNSCCYFCKGTGTDSNGGICSNCKNYNFNGCTNKGCTWCGGGVGQWGNGKQYCTNCSGKGGLCKQQYVCPGETYYTCP